MGSQCCAFLPSRYWSLDHTVKQQPFLALLVIPSRIVVHFGVTNATLAKSLEGSLQYQTVKAGIPSKKRIASQTEENWYTTNVVIIPRLPLHALCFGQACIYIFTYTHDMIKISCISIIHKDILKYIIYNI